MMTLAVARKQRRELLREIASEHKRKDREKLLELRAAIRDTTARRKVALREAVLFCRAGRARARERAKERVLELRAAAKEAIRQARVDAKLGARAACDARKQEIRDSPLTSKRKALETLRAERKYQQTMRRMERSARARERAKERRTSARERQEESDDQVRQDIPAELVPLFNRIRRQIKGSAYRSRAEEFMEYVAENPELVVEMQEELAQREIARLIREEAALAQALRQKGRYKPTPAELARIPF